MFRLPLGVLDPETARQYCNMDTASPTETDSHLILGLYAETARRTRRAARTLAVRWD